MQKSFVGSGYSTSIIIKLKADGSMRVRPNNGKFYAYKVVNTE